MLVNRLRRRVEVEGEDAWVEVRPLSWLEWREVREAAEQAALDKVRRIGVDVVREIAGQRQEPAPEAQGPTATDVLDAVDVALVLERGVVAWSYEEPVTPETVRLLDERTARQVARAIVEWTTGADADPKHGCEPSTAT